MLLLCGFLLKIFLTNTLAYNLDITNANVFVIPQKLQDRQRNSYFGYSTTLYNNGQNISGVLIGAPRANSSYLQSVLEPGTVYMCLLNNVCKEWVVDKSKNTINTNRNNSWTGAIVMTENNGIHSKVLVCAPRWLKKHTYWYINGICYWTTADSLKSFEKESKKITNVYPINEKSSQIGFSADISSDESGWNVILGDPGINYGEGASVYFTQSTSSSKLTITSSNKFTQRYNNYLGYSTTFGFYFSKKERLFASGSPRGNNMKGYVVVYSFSKGSRNSMTISNILNGYQFGEYFGSTLASCDLNNDGRDDLIVGAPFWTRDIDEGRVYIFNALKNNNFMKGLEIEGDVSGGRFGSSITCLGDIDYDGYNDIIIGAPYEGNSGAIYLYNSDKDGNLKCSQKIIGSELSSNVRGFGISISKPLDINGDKYLDIAVGAYLSEQVFLLKFIPVVTITTNLEFPHKKSLSRDSESFLINICTFYHGLHAPIELNITHYLEIDLLYKRAYLKDEKTYCTYNLSTTLEISKRRCDPLTIHLKRNIQNVINPITLSVLVDINNSTQEVNKSSNIVHRTPALLNKLNSKTKDIIQLPFILECGDDNICNSDLRISLQTNLEFNNTYIIGSASDLKLIIDVYNNGEHAYQTQVHIFIPNPLSLASIPTACLESAKTNENVFQVICDIGNPLTNENNKTMVLELDASKVRFDVKSLELFANVSTKSEEINKIDKNYTMDVYFDIDVDIAIAGKAQDNVYSYSQEDEESLQNIRFKHIYEVQKFGLSPINEATLSIEIPTRWKSTDYDIELISINQTIAYMDGNILNLKINDMDDCQNCQTNVKLHDENQFNFNNTPIIISSDDSLKKSTNASLENRVLFMNCSNQQIVCKKIECTLNPFISSLSVAQLIITFDFKVSNIVSSFLKDKNIILFASKGRVNITQPPNVIQGSTNKPDITVITTKFEGSPINERVAMWIIALSIFLGIAVFILINLALIKLGFYQRKKKEQLEALKATSNDKGSMVLNTTSSEPFDLE
ncbi:PREDICTED: integrin alpha-PS4-like isoform X2 [Polistes dominula]|uniref:Integrin alpha-PS4-like isoform X2 n=1 Tax=Polistes dominula TaxID=743375 RepID=A0ABM1IU81_POLDO|nr:PREDICTED: integrin alpha-PS4-like isoform X2 [Polistes dominula]